MIVKIAFDWACGLGKAQELLSPDCGRKKKNNLAHHNYKNDKAMTECVIILYPA